MYFNLVTGNTCYEMPEDETLAGSENVTRMLIGEYHLFTKINIRIQINVDILLSASVLSASIFITYKHVCMYESVSISCLYPLHLFPYKFFWWGTFQHLVSWS